MNENYKRLYEEKAKYLRLWDEAYLTLSRSDDISEKTVFETLDEVVNKKIKKIEELADTLNKLGLLTIEETEDIKALCV